MKVSLFLSFGVVFWVAGFDILYSLQDMHIDKKLGLHSIPARFGSTIALIVSKVFHSIAIVFWFLF